MNYLLGCAEKLMEGFCCHKDEQSQNSLKQLEEDLTAMDEIERKIQRWKIDGVYHCSEVCDKKYKTKGRLKHHLREKHNWTIPELGRHSRQGKASHQVGSSRDVRGAFMRAALLMRSTYKTYKTGDGDRIFRNAKFEFLYAFALKQNTGCGCSTCWHMRKPSFLQSRLSPINGTAAVTCRGSLTLALPMTTWLSFKLGM